MQHLIYEKDLSELSKHSASSAREEESDSATISSLNHAFRSLRGVEFNEKEVESLMAKVSKKVSGHIPMQKWVVTVIEILKAESIETLESHFKVFHGSEDQIVSLEEIKFLLEASRKLNPAMVDSTVQEFEKHGKHELKLKEFKDFIKKLLT